LLITFREALEVALVAAIILSFMVRSGRHGLGRYVWCGMVAALVASLGMGTAIWVVYSGLPEAVEPLFEVVAAYVAVVILSTMIYWMATRGKSIKQEMEKRVEAITSRGTVIGFILLGFVIVFREGLETVLFLTPLLTTDAIGTLIGTAAGVFAAVLLAYAIFVIGVKINLHRFFCLTSILLILLAGGLTGSGTHELLEYTEKAGLNAGWLAQPAYSLSIPEGNPFHHEGIIGSIFAVLFDYTVSAEWARLIVHVAYLAITLPIVIHIYRKTERHA
jgi:high-affinity iron transporter